MPTKPQLKGPTAWSYSRLNTYRQCPYRYKLTVIEKRKEPESSALLRGQTIHKLAENYIKGISKSIAPELKTFTAEFKALKKFDVDAETQWAFTREWKTTEWFAYDVWNRMVIDAAALVKPKKKGSDIILRVIDFKTGKVYGENEEQLGLYALGGMSRYPEVDAVETELWYLDQGEEKKIMFSREKVPELVEYWDKETKALFKDKTFAPRPGDHCRWCPFSKSKGGPCKY
jgi:CRISPR/Cas system-associated exonuclease Cas4 (RecB family)